MRGRMIIIVLALAAVGVAFKASSGAKTDKPAQAKAPANAVRLTFVYSPEKEPLLAPLIKRFNAERNLIGSRPVFVEAQVVASGDAQTRIAEGSLQPTLWSPASSFWGRLLNYEADRPLVADENPSIVRTPLVIAMWKRLADAYGYPQRKLGYKQLEQLATGGWAAVGKPEFGSFKYVHTNPDFSTSGLSAVAASYYAAVGKKEGLTEADVTRGRAQVRRLERSIVHYGDTTLFISDEMRGRGLGYASAVAMEEITLLDFNRRAGDGERLVAVYPQEGTFFSDNPLMTLQGDWVSDEQRRAAKVFSDVPGRAGHARAGRPPWVPPRRRGRGAGRARHACQRRRPRAAGARPAPARAEGAGQAQADVAGGPQAGERDDGLRQLRLDGRGEQARAGRRGPEGVLPRSRSAGSHRPDQVLRPDHAAGGDRADEDQPRRAAGRDRHDPARRTTRASATRRSPACRPSRPRSTRTPSTPWWCSPTVTTPPRRAAPATWSASCEAQRRKESGQIRVFTIAYGREPNADELADYAKASGGNSYEGGGDDIESIYRSISSFF